MALGEFELIARYFSRPVARRDVLLGVGDDAALLEVPAGQALAAATDTLVEGRHFLPDAPPESVGHQALAVNLSDLAAMGAEPAWALLALSLPEPDDAWLEGFARGFHALADRAGLALVGGDTVRGPLVVTVQVLGFVPAALALRRDGARPGDVLYVSGTLGDAAAGLELLRGGAASGYRFAAGAGGTGSPSRGLRSAWRCAVSRARRWTSRTGCSATSASFATRAGSARSGARAVALSPALLASFDARAARSGSRSAAATITSCYSRFRRRRRSEIETTLGTAGTITRIGEIVAGHGVRCQRAGQTVEARDRRI